MTIFRLLGPEGISYLCRILSVNVTRMFLLILDVVIQDPDLHRSVRAAIEYLDINSCLDIVVQLMQLSGIGFSTSLQGEGL